MVTRLRNKRRGRRKRKRQEDEIDAGITNLRFFLGAERGTHGHTLRHSQVAGGSRDTCWETNGGKRKKKT